MCFFNIVHHDDGFYGSGAPDRGVVDTETLPWNLLADIYQQHTELFAPGRKNIQQSTGTDEVDVAVRGDGQKSA